MKIKKSYLAYIKRVPSWKRKFKMVEWILRNKQLWGPYPIYAKIEIDQRCNLKCFTEDTLVLMSDFSWKKISEVELGEMVIGVNKPEEKYKHYKFVSSKVTHVFEPEISEIVEITFVDGTKIRTTPTHEFLSKHGRWRHAVDMTNIDPPKWTLKPEPHEETYGYVKGYLSGAWHSDGHLWEKKYPTTTARRARFAVKDKEFLEIVDKYLRIYDIELERKQFHHSTIKEMIQSCTKEVKEEIESLIEFPNTIDSEWSRGYLAGFFDGDGSYDGNTIGIVNTDKILIDMISFCLSKFGFDFSVVEEQPEYPGSKLRYVVRLRGGRSEDWRFFVLTQSKISRKRKITGSVYGTIDIESIKSVGKAMVYNLETESSNYIANGAVVHNCPKCYRNEVVNNKFLTRERFSEILDKLEPGLCEVYTHGFGEPTFHPDFITMMADVVDRGMLWGLATNGATKFFDDDQNIMQMLWYQPTKIRFSVDGADKETFERERFPAKFAKVVDNIKQVVDTRNEMYPNKKDKNRPRIDLYCVLTMQTLDQIGPMIDLRDNLGCDWLTFSDLAWNNDFGTSVENNAVRQMMTPDEINKMIEPFKDRPRVQFNIPRPEKRTCDYPKFHVYVDAEGWIYPCTCVPGKEKPFYNIFDPDIKHIKEIYQSKQYDVFREQSKTGMIPSKECYRCLQWGPDWSDV